MSAAFSSAESASLERSVDLSDDNVMLDEIWGNAQKKDCILWINKNEFKTVCLQFPDSYLGYSTKINEDLKTASEAKFFILADTSYGSCCVDEIAAAHIDADSLIHFGNACLSKTSRLPVFYVFPRLKFCVESFVEKVKQYLSSVPSDSLVNIYFDLAFSYVIDNVRESLSDYLNISLSTFPHRENDSQRDGIYSSIFVGKDNQTFFNLSMATKARAWLIYDSVTNTLIERNPLATNWIRRRYFYIEKLKDAQTIGLVVATLSADGYLDIVKHLQQLARNREIRTHIISVGRINPAKLANFMEIDCFVLIGCPYNSVFASKDFFKPIVTVFEAEIALNPAWHLSLPEVYSTNFKDILPKGQLYRELKLLNDDAIEADVSLVTGKVRGVKQEMNVENGSNALIGRKNYEISTSSRTDFEDRTWKGLEQSLGRTEPAKIEKGLRGIPIKYTHD